MAKALNQKIIIEQVDQPEGKKLLTPDGKHPFAVRVLDVSDELNTPIKKGDLIAVEGGIKEFINDKFVINYAQATAILDEDEL